MTNARGGLCSITWLTCCFCCWRALDSFKAICSPFRCVCYLASDNSLFYVDSDWRLSWHCSYRRLLSNFAKSKCDTFAAVCFRGVQIMRRFSVTHVCDGLFLDKTDLLYKTEYIPFSVHVIQSLMDQCLESFLRLLSSGTVLEARNV